MQTVLITGCDRGLGLEFARQYAAEPETQVIATCREPQSAEELHALAQELGNITIEPLDVTDAAQLDALTAKYAGQPIDILINNAGVSPKADGKSLVDEAIWLNALHVNAVAPGRVTMALRENLILGKRKLVAAITSELGSIGANKVGGWPIYRSSKAALNAAMHTLAYDLQADGITVAIVHPGWVKTTIGGPRARFTATESIAAVRQLLSAYRLEDTGTMKTYDGKVIPW